MAATEKIVFSGHSLISPTHLNQSDIFETSVKIGDIEIKNSYIMPCWIDLNLFVKYLAYPNRFLWDYRHMWE